MATYKTAPLSDYNPLFQDVAQRLFNLSSGLVLPECAITEKGSYSFKAAEGSHETIVKVLIFQPGLGIEMQGDLPWRSEGVYVLVRADGEYGDAIWRQALEPSCRSRMRREDNIAVAPQYDARFSYFPVMAGESLEAIAGFIASLIQNTATHRHVV